VTEYKIIPGTLLPLDQFEVAYETPVDEFGRVPIVGREHKDKDVLILVRKKKNEE
jgi:hypothetical protein